MGVPAGFDRLDSALAQSLEVNNMAITMYGERDAMIEAADDWGPSSDPSRRWFIAGWCDERDGMLYSNKPTGDHQTNVEDWCGYNSGVIAYREYARSAG